LGGLPLVFEDAHHDTVVKFTIVKQGVALDSFAFEAELFIDVNRTWIKVEDIETNTVKTDCFKRVVEDEVQRFDALTFAEVLIAE
jgi:hypothetical protein